MRFAVRHWFDIGGIAAAPVALWALLGGWSTVQMILLLNFAVLLVHQFEEYRWPGGEPWILNEVVMPKGGPYDRRPTNQLSRIYINLIAWPFYFVPVFFPDVVWLGLATVLFGAVGQLVAHGILTPIKLKTLYNPGLAAVLLGHVPLGIWYVVVVYQQHLIQWWDWLAAIAYLAFFMGVLFQRIGFKVVAPRGEEQYPYDLDEYNRWGRERRLRRAGITPAIVLVAAKS
jgi:hypothetical protein